MADKLSDRSSPFGSSVKPEDHDGPDVAGQAPMKTDKHEWDSGDGLLATRGDNTLATPETAPSDSTGEQPHVGRIARTEEEKHE